MSDKMRRADRQITDPVRIEEILGKAKVLHMALYDDEYPYVVPLHYGYCFENDQLILYCHGAKEGKKLDLINKNPKVCIELDCEVEAVDGGDVACQYSSYYASVIGFGTACILEEVEDKKEGLNCLMLNQAGRTFEFNENMVRGVAVIKITLDRYTAKAKQKPVS